MSTPAARANQALAFRRCIEQPSPQELDGLRSRAAFAAYLAPLRKKKWFVYGKPPFAGPEAVLAYLARYTHRVAISNSRLIGLDDRGVTFGFKNYRRNGRERYRPTPWCSTLNA